MHMCGIGTFNYKYKCGREGGKEKTCKEASNKRAKQEDMVLPLKPHIFVRLT